MIEKLRLINILVLAGTGITSPLSGQVTSAEIDSVLSNTVWERMRDITPESYVAPLVSSSIQIDGQLDDVAWNRARWSSNFVDIEGAGKPPPKLRTRMKILWDEHYLYIGAELEEPHLWATFTEKNSVIFHDDDFEIFIDPDGDNHNYYEFEVNALNAIWELRLLRPYRDGGPAISGENIAGLRSAVALHGTINDPTDLDVGWSVEVAIPWDGFASYDAGHLPPESGDQWRINFSRVDHVIDAVSGSYIKQAGSAVINWVWSAQGIVDMHMPERWGFVQFGVEEQHLQRFILEKDWQFRERLMEVYHREKAYRSLTGTYASDVNDLLLCTNDERCRISLSATVSTFDAAILVYSKFLDPLELRIDETGQIFSEMR